jgi:hypothetical protein
LILVIACSTDVKGKAGPQQYTSASGNRTRGRFSHATLEQDPKTPARA